MPRELLTMTGTYAQFEGTEIVAKNCLSAKVRDLVIKGKTHISGVPVDYTILDYIESTGTQYIDTGFKANTTTTKFVGAFTPTQKVMAALLGSRNETTSGTHACNAFVLETGNFRVDWANGNYNGNEISYVVGTKYEMEITRGTLVINGTAKSFSNRTSIDQLGNFLIGTFTNVKKPYADGFVGYIHECKLYSNDVLIRDFIPVKRISDNVVGMYDIVTETFFTNAGTGEFIAGESVSSSPSSYLKSVAEEEGNVLSIINKGKNLIGVLTQDKSWDTSTSNLKDNAGAFCTEKIKVKNNTTYVYSVNGVKTNVGILAFNAKGKHISNAYISGITITDGVEYIALQGRNPDIGVGGEMLEEGTTPTTYEPYRDPTITTINLPIPLRSLSDEIYDTIEGNKLIQRVGVNDDNTYYELDTPITHSLEISSISTIKGTNIITTENEIKPIINCKLKLSKASKTN